MKEIKIIVIAVIIIIVIMVSCAYAMPAYADEDKGEFYPKLTIVVGYQHITADEWLIECMDKTGEIWTFYGDKDDAHIGNIFNLLMWNIGEFETENEIIEVYWEGYIENPKLFCHIFISSKR